MKKNRKKQLEKFGYLLDIMDNLRENCPWDKKQTFKSLKNLTIEETYELSEAQISNNFDEIKNQPVNDFISQQKKDVLIDEQNEIFLDDLNYKAPGIDILTQPDSKIETSANQEELNLNAEKLKNVLIDFKIEGEIIKVSPGPIVTMYELQPAPGIKALSLIHI